jgi:hypothetical protein
MNIGDRVKVMAVPPGLYNDGVLNTKSLLEACLGRQFPVIAIEQGLLELHVGELNGQPAYLHSIWIEPEFVEAVRKKS